MGRPSNEPRSKKKINGASKNDRKRVPPEIHPAGRRSDEGQAFLPDPYDGAGAPARVDDPFAETLAEEFVASATSAEETTEDDRDRMNSEEVGGPFTETSAAEEFASEPDESNPIDAEREPFPTATRLPT